MAYERMRVLMGYNDKGNPIYRQISGKTQNQRNDSIVQAYIDNGRIWEFLPELANMKMQSEASKPGLHPLDKYAWNWYWRYKDPSPGASTKVTQQGFLRSICGYFGCKPLEELTVDDIQDYLNSMQHLVRSTVNARHKCLKAILNAACEDGIIQKNPAASSRLMNPGTTNTGIHAMKRDDYRKLLEKLPFLEDRNIKLLLALMTFTGLRREEVLGLRWEDINFKTQFIHVQRAIVLPLAAPVVKSTKTRLSNRFVPMCDMLADILLEHWMLEGYIVTDHQGKLFTKSRYKAFWQRVKEAVDLPHLDARQLRHTYATMNAAAGVEMKTLGACMGHSTISTTADIYTQVEPTRLNDIRNVLTDFVFNC